MGVEALAIFGSTARGDARPDSDVDVAARLRDGARVGVFGFLRIEARLAEVLGRRVDLVSEPADAPRLQAQIDRDRIDVF